MRVRRGRGEGERKGGEREEGEGRGGAKIYEFEGYYLLSITSIIISPPSTYLYVLTWYPTELAS